MGTGKYFLEPVKARTIYTAFVLLMMFGCASTNVLEDSAFEEPDPYTVSQLLLAEKLVQGAYADQAKAYRIRLSLLSDKLPENYFNLGYMSEFGLGRDVNYVEALGWYKKAAELGVGTAYSNIGLIYDDGKGVPVDDAEAVRWYTLGAELGDVASQNNLGAMYDVGEGVKQNLERAAYWYCTSAKQGAPESLRNCGGMYEAGKGVDQDYVVAAQYYQQAAKIGLPKAMINIGFLYERGLGVTQDYDLAVRYYSAAAFGGELIGARNLSYMYSNAVGVEEDRYIALAWLIIADLISGNPLTQLVAKDRLNTLVRAEADEALILFAEWVDFTSGGTVSEAYYTWPPTYRRGDSYAELSDTELEIFYRAAEIKRSPDVCEKILPLSIELLRRDPSDSLKREKRYFNEIGCAWSEGRWEDAYRAIQPMEASLGRTAGWMGVALSHLTGRDLEMVERLEKLAVEDDYWWLTRVDPRRFWAMYRDLNDAGKDDLGERFVLAMTESPHFWKLDNSFRSGLSLNRLRLNSENGTDSDSAKWVSNLDSPTLFVRLLAHKKYEHIWPMLEEVVGANFSAISGRYLEQKRSEANQNPLDLEARSAAANAMLFAGEFEQLKAFITTPKNYSEAISEQEAWALNAKAYAHAAIGEWELGASILGGLSAIPVAENNENWLVNFAINHAWLLVGEGQWQRAYDAVIHAEQFRGSEYAQMLVSFAKVCALANLNSEDDLSPLLEEIYNNREHEYSSAARAMMCAGRDMEAAELVIEALENEEYRERVIEDLQTYEFVLYHDESSLPNLNSLLSTEPSVRSAFDKVGRLIPEEFIPIAGLKRRAH